MNSEDTCDNGTKHSIGIRLRRAREKLFLSQKEIAERLHLKVSTVRDIEEDRTPSDLALTFFRGYIRSYAKLVHIPEGELLPIVNQEYKTKEEKTLLIHRSSLGIPCKKYDKWLTIFSWLVFFVIVGVTGTWWRQKNKELQEKNSSMINRTDKRLYPLKRKVKNLPLNNGDSFHLDKSQIPSILSSIQTRENMKDTEQNLEDLLLSEKEEDDAIPKITIPLTSDKKIHSLQTNHTAISSSDEDLDLLTMSFNADCWLEISNETGEKSLFSGLRHRNENVFFVGKMPYQIKIGSPEAVRIQFQGKPIDISRFIKNNKAVRLVLNAG